MIRDKGLWIVFEMSKDLEVLPLEEELSFHYVFEVLFEKFFIAGIIDLLEFFLVEGNGALALQTF